MFFRRMLAVVALLTLLMNTGCCCYRCYRPWRCGRCNTCCHECEPTCCGYRGPVAEPVMAPPLAH
jgi:hypothetical protein